MMALCPLLESELLTGSGFSSRSGVCKSYRSAKVVCEGTTKFMESEGDPMLDICEYISRSRLVCAFWILLWMSNESYAGSS